MAGTSDITLEELPEIYQDLERQHLVPLWEIAPGGCRASRSRKLSRTSGAGPTLHR